jgi:hypothetical protein
MACGLQRAAGGAPHGRIVVDHEDLGHHLSSPRCGTGVATAHQ